MPATAAALDAAHRRAGRPPCGDRPRRCRARAGLPAIAEDAAALRRELGAALGRMLRPAELDALAGPGRALEQPAGRRGAGGRRAARHVDGHPPDHGDRRSLRPGHAVHAGARRPGARVSPAAGRRRAGYRSPRASSARRSTARRPRWAAAAPTSPPRCSAPCSTSSGWVGCGRSTAPRCAPKAAAGRGPHQGPPLRRRRPVRRGGGGVGDGGRGRWCSS